jgi:hypothetical protein
MVAAPEYSLEKQAKLVNTICALHNFICVNDPGEADLDEDFMADVERATPQHVREDFATDVSAVEREEASQKRDEIAKAMWEEYLVYNQST